MRKRLSRAAALAVVAAALVCPQLALARIVRQGTGTKVTCTTTPTLLDDTSVPNSAPRWMLIQNRYGNAPVVIGRHVPDTSPLTYDKGIELRGDQAYAPAERVGTESEAQLYCITASGTVDVRVREEL